MATINNNNGKAAEMLTLPQVHSIAKLNGFDSDPF